MTISMKKIKCELCGFSDSFQTLVKTKYGIFHQECLDDSEKELDPGFSFQKQLEEFDLEAEIRSRENDMSGILDDR